jgi:citrate synthase
MLIDLVLCGMRSARLLQTSSRLFSASAVPNADDLKAAFAAALPREQERLKHLRQTHGSKRLHGVTVDMVIGGMRGITGLLYETSFLDPDEGIRYRGYTIPELQVCPIAIAALSDKLSGRVFYCEVPFRLILK